MAQDITVAEAKAAQAEVMNEFADLVQRARVSPVHVTEFGKNLANYRDASEAVWEAQFRAIADTGVRISVE